MKPDRWVRAGVLNLIWSVGLLPQAMAAAPRPDIVIFLTDDHSQLDATPYGGRGIRTPNMQRLAEAGLTFERAYVASPSCARFFCG